MMPTLAADVAIALRRVQREDLAGFFAHIPTAWPVFDEELGCVEWFLRRRAGTAADRLWRRFGRSVCSAVDFSARNPVRRSLGDA
jgi:hypothetical protein